MSALAHAGVGLAAKRLAPKIPVGVLIIAAYMIDIVWSLFFLAGIENLPGSGLKTTNPWSHGLFMAVIWSVLSGLVATLFSRNRRMGLFIGLLVFSHWVIDFISHPMRAAFPDDTGLSLLFDGSPTVGLGLWSSELITNIGEYGALALGLVIYISTLIKSRKKIGTGPAPINQEG